MTAGEGELDDIEVQKLSERHIDEPRQPTHRRRQMRKLTRKQALNANDVSGHLSTMSRDITVVAGAGFEQMFYRAFARL
jgi:hypothetical protein